MTNLPPPDGDQMASLLAQSHQRITAALRPRRGPGSARRQMIGAGVAATLVIGAVSASAAVKPWTRDDVPETTTTYFPLEVPTWAKGVTVHMTVTCNPGTEFMQGINPNSSELMLTTAGVTCGDEKRQHRFESGRFFNLCEYGAEMPRFSFVVVTDSTDPVTIRAKYHRNTRKYDGEIATCTDHSAPVPRTTRTPSSDPWTHPSLWPDPYFINENGMAIGMVRINTPANEYPDLMPAVGTNGRRGFTPVPNSYAMTPPRWKAELKRLGYVRYGKGKYKVPLYAIDGKTRIGWVLR